MWKLPLFETPYIERDRIRFFGAPPILPATKDSRVQKAGERRLLGTPPFPLPPTPFSLLALFQCLKKFKRTGKLLLRCRKPRPRLGNELFRRIRQEFLAAEARFRPGNPGDKLLFLLFKF